MQNIPLGELAIGRKKVLENASELIEEAILLFNNQKYARSYALAHLACEELEKLPLLGATQAKLKAGLTIDWKLFFDNFRSHEYKLKSLLMFPDLIISDGKFEKERFEGINNTFKIANKRKNESIYTSIRGQRFQNPSETIDKLFAESMLFMAELSYGYFEIIEKAKLEERDDKLNTFMFEFIREHSQLLNVLKKSQQAEGT